MRVKKETPFEPAAAFFSRFLYGGKGLLVAFLILLPLKIYRAGNENSLWIDEVYTLLLSFRPWKEMIHLTALDNHPPLYYGLLRNWILWGKELGCTNDLLWARLFNVVLWAFFCMGTWFSGRRLLGKTGGVFLTWSVAGGAQVAQVTKDLRGYAISLFSVFAALTLLVYLLKNPMTGRGIKVILKAVILWGLYALFGIIALYSHLLTSFAFMLFGITWFFLLYREKEDRFFFFWGGVLSQVLILILFIPWMTRLTGQVSYVQGSNLLWMTPPTIWNLLRVFLFWFPFGQTPDPPIEASFYAYLAGALTFLFPWGAFILAGGFFPDHNESRTFFRTLAILAGTISVAFVFILFGIRWLTGLQVFHGPRYPAIVTPVWTLGLVAASIYAAERFKRRSIFVFLLLLPWFFCNIIGQAWSFSHERNEGLDKWKKSAAAFMPAKGEPLYVLPPELIPYYKNSLEEYHVKGIEDILQTAPSQQDILVLNLNPWKLLQTTRDTVILGTIQTGSLSESLEKKEKHKDIEDFQSYRLKNFDRNKARSLFRDGIEPAKRDIPESAVAVALPENQWLDEGWSIDEVDSSGNLFRWAMGKETIVRFSGTIMPGMYALHFAGFRTPHPTEMVEMSFKFKRQLEVYNISHGPGSFHIEIPVRMTLKHRNPILKVKHPTWRPIDADENSKDKRPLTFLFLYAWLETKPV
ncbi:hypothetical protein JW926_05790 [Candidatus Sumerlaeota bacterium]|nr:hypothetical protein [Candidatus Sumerlaeota bacterium]